MNKKAFSTVVLFVCLSVMSAVAFAQQPRSQSRRSGGLDNLSLPSTDISLASGSWQSVAPEGAGFSVMMPGLPEEESRSFGQGRVALQMYHVKVNDMEYSAGAVLNFPPDMLQQPGFAARYFQYIPGVMIDSTEYRHRHYHLIAQRSVSTNDYPGRQYKFDSPEYTSTMRVYLGERTIYILIVESPKASVSNDNVEKFLSSFALKEN